MFRKIMVPVDLGHLDRLENALTAAADLARLYGSAVTFVAVTTETPGQHAHTPAEFQSKLEAFAEEQARQRKIPNANARSYSSTDPAADLDRTLLSAVEDSGADLVVVGTHRPGFAEHIFSSHAGHLAVHAPVSVMVVR